MSTKISSNGSSGSFSLYCCTKSSFQNPPPPEVVPEEKHAAAGGGSLSISRSSNKKQPGGWRAMPYILGNETFERLATFGLMANFMVYLTKEFHMDQVSASNVINIWWGITNFVTLVGAFISDAYIGRFWTITFASFASLSGMLTVTLTAWLPQLHPPYCQSINQTIGQCPGPKASQLTILLTGLGLLSIGTGGIRPCSIPFGIDQFDPTTEKGAKGINSYFNWYYTTFTIVLIIAQTLVVYIQDSISWVLGFGIPTILLASSIMLFFVGTRIYVYVKPEGSIFSGIVQVLVAAYKKRHLKLPKEGKENEIGIFYDPPLRKGVLAKIPLTNQFRCLNKAAIIMENELKPDGTRDPWQLSSIQEVEEIKCLVKVVPVWASGIVSFTSMVQQGTFTVSQALKMDRHLGSKFQIPAGSIGVISLITIGLWLPFYDRILVPRLRRLTKRDGGITLLQRTGVGIVFSVLAMLIAGGVERMRRASALLHPELNGVARLSVMWLAPQLTVMGLCEAFNIIGMIEFLNTQFPEHMRSIANSLFCCAFGGASYLSSLVVTVVHQVTGGQGRPDWLTNDINAGRLDYFYYLLAVMGLLNFVYFLCCANCYRYKNGVLIGTEENCPDVELCSNRV